MHVTLIARALVAATLMGCALWQPANAADTTSGQSVSKDAPATDASPWQVRVRALAVLPDASGSTVNVANLPTLSSPNSGLSIGNSIVPELDISYFFTRNVAAELVLGVTQHHIMATGALANLDVGSTWLLPPTLTLQYHFTDFGAFKPYVGIGLNYTFFFGQAAAGAATYNGLSITSLSLHNTVGGAVQAGFDYMIDKHWGVNFDVKKLLLRPTYDAMVNGSIPVSGTAVIDPWLIGAGITYRF